MTDTIHTTGAYEPDLTLLDAAATDAATGGALAREAIAVAAALTTITKRSELVAAIRAAKLAAKTAREAALAYDRAAELLQLEASRQAGRLTPPANLHRERQDADNPAPTVNTFCPWLG